MKWTMLICVIAAVQDVCFGACNMYAVDRSNWGARSPKDGIDTLNTPVEHIFIHHTETPSCSDRESCARRIRSIQNYHMNERGWNDIGYSFLIGGDNKVYTGRGWSKVGAHTYGWNAKSIGFALIGNFDQEPTPSRMINATKEWIQCALHYNYVTPNFKIHGHKDSKCTDCPGKFLYQIIQGWENFEGGPLNPYFC